MGFSWRQFLQPLKVLNLHYYCFIWNIVKKNKSCLNKCSENYSSPTLTEIFFLFVSLKNHLHHCGYLSNSGQLSSTSQVSALARKKKKHVPITLPRQHKGMFDWAAASVRHTCSRTAERNLRSCTLHQGLLCPNRHLSLSVVMLLLVLLPPPWLHTHGARSSSHRFVVVVSVPVCSLFNTDTCQEAIKSKTLQADFWFEWFLFRLFSCVAFKILSRYINHPDSCVKPISWSHRLVVLPQEKNLTFWTGSSYCLATHSVVIY